MVRTRKGNDAMRAYADGTTTSIPRRSLSDAAALIATRGARAYTVAIQPNGGCRASMGDARLAGERARRPDIEREDTRMRTHRSRVSRRDFLGRAAAVVGGVSVGLAGL